jgi:hypothetical protein
MERADASARDEMRSNESRDSLLRQRRGENVARNILKHPSAALYLWPPLPRGRVAFASEPA